MLSILQIHLTCFFLSEMQTCLDSRVLCLTSTLPSFNFLVTNYFIYEHFPSVVMHDCWFAFKLLQKYKILFVLQEQGFSVILSSCNFQLIPMFCLGVTCNKTLHTWDRCSREIFWNFLRQETIFIFFSYGFSLCSNFYYKLDDTKIL